MKRNLIIGILSLFYAGLGYAQQDNSSETNTDSGIRNPFITYMYTADPSALLLLSTPQRS